MPIRLEWHSELPVLQATYSGVLSPNEYAAMCRQRAEMIHEGPEHIVLVMDAQKLEGFPDAGTIKRCESVLHSAKVYRLLVVIPNDLYHRLSGAIITHSELLVHFYPDLDHALDDAQRLARS
jgi:hypothetical protein